MGTQINDPQNLGSIIRTAVFLGIDHIITTLENSCPLTPAVCKVSSGASELNPIYSVRYSQDFINEAIKSGFKIISFALPEESKEAKEEINTISIDKLSMKPSDNVIIIFGNEGDGIEARVKGMADLNIFIPPQLDSSIVGKYPFNIVDSLNVGACAAVALYKIRECMKRQK